MSLPWPNAQLLSRLDEVLNNLPAHRLGLLGLGVAGRAMATYLAHRGASVLSVDVRPDIDCEALETLGVQVRLGPVDENTFAEVDLLVLSPGADPRQPAVRALLQRNIPVCGELELLGALPAEVIGITGTNGKSTTTALIGALLAATDRSTFVGGNFGEPISAWIDRGDPADVAVVELSSFQLESAYRFAPEVAVVLNVSDDHAERYDSIDDYTRAKQRIVDNLPATATAVLNYEDQRVAAMHEATEARTFWFSTDRALPAGDGIWLEGDRVRATDRLASLDGFELSHPRLFGIHNRQNALAGLLACHALGAAGEADRDRLQAAYLEFAGLAHRLELVCQAQGVRWINDTKATNDAAAAVALRAMDSPVILLLGGMDKGGGYAEVHAEAIKRARLVIAFGQAREVIAAEFVDHPGLQICDTMHAAMTEASVQAQPGEAVLLAPACSSFDEFANYARRGETFRTFARGLTEGASA